MTKRSVLEEQLKIELEKVTNFCNDLNININNNGSLSYDGILVKKLAASNTLDRDSGHQTHIAITSKEMDIFPYVNNYSYLISEERDNTYKRNFIMKLPVQLMSNNLKYLRKKVLDQNNIINCFTTAARSRRKDDSQQIELSYKGEDSTDFINFRKLLQEDDYIVFLKKEKSVEYTVLGVKNVDAEKYSLNNVIVVYPSYTPVSNELVMNKNDEIQDNPIDESVSRNQIIYGAPGTGKSYQLEEERKKYFPESSLYERVTFHPRYTYNNFLGTYKPITLYKKSDQLLYDSDMKSEREKQMEPVIDYNFVPGPFIKVLTKALKNKNKNYLLIIEEINRSDPAAVFGDIFQLLDRDETGKSRYPVTFNRDVMNYLNRKVDYFNNEFVIIPSNLYIWATMNSADQGVKSMDSAFRRRWSFNYIKLNEYQQIIKDKKIKLSFLNSKIYWNEFRSIINGHLKNYVREDKLIGPFFLTDIELMDQDSIKNKLLFYLCEDVLRHNPGQIFNLQTFNQIIEAYENKENIFIEKIYQNLKASEIDYIEQN